MNGNDGSTSRSLLAGARGDDPAAWTRLVSLYAPLVAAWCRRWGVAPQDVMDIVQEVFGSVARSLDRFRKEQPCDTFRGWLATISRNKVRDYFRRRGDEPTAAGGTEAWMRISQVCDPDCDSSSGNEIVAAAAEFSTAEFSAAEFSDVLRRALDQIRSEFQERTWQAFWRTVVEGRSAADVATELSMQPGAVRVSKSRVLCRLRQELGDQPLTPLPLGEGGERSSPGEGLPDHV